MEKIVKLEQLRETAEEAARFSRELAAEVAGAAAEAMEELAESGPWLPLSGGTLTGDVVARHFKYSSTVSSSFSPAPLGLQINGGVNAEIGEAVLCLQSGNEKGGVILSTVLPGAGVAAGAILRGLKGPVNNNDAATKKYVDDLVGDIATLLDSINGEVA